jgi:hypothetical protein
MSNDPNRFRSITFKEICDALQWVATDTLVSVCSCIFDQKNGLQMGSTLSPVLARLYLDSGHDRLYRRPQTIVDLRQYVAHLGRATRTWVASACHVDDSVWISRAICSACLLHVAKAVWPLDVGLTLEEAQLPFTFLHTTLSERDGQLQVNPRMPNAGFSQGLVEQPVISTYPVYRHRLATRTHLQQILGAKLHLLIRGCWPEDPAAFGRACILFSLEPLALGWPPAWTAGILCSINYVRNRSATRLACRLGSWLRAHTVFAARSIKRQHLTGSEQGLSVLYDSWYDCVLDYIRT